MLVGSQAGSENVCKVAFVGAGGMAREHLRAFQDVPGVVLAGIMGRTRQRATALAQEYGIHHVCETVVELYEKTNADLVVVAVPALETREVCLSCFRHPWTLLIEKPAGYNVTEAEIIERAAAGLGRRAFVALNRRQYGSTRRVIADLVERQGPRLIKVQDQEDPVAALRAGHPHRIVENMMYTNSIHIIDLFRLLGRGKVTDVVPVIRWNSSHPRYVAAKILFESGDIGLYEGIWEGPGPWLVSVNTPDMRWEMRPLERASFQPAGKRTLEQVEEEAWDHRFKPGFRRQAALAVDAAMRRRSDLPTLQDALETMRLVQAIFA